MKNLTLLLAITFFSVPLTYANSCDESFRKEAMSLVNNFKNDDWFSHNEKRTVELFDAGVKDFLQKSYIKIFEASDKMSSYNEDIASQARKKLSEELLPDFRQLAEAIPSKTGLDHCKVVDQGNQTPVGLPYYEMSISCRKEDQNKKTWITILVNEDAVENDQVNSMYIDSIISIGQTDALENFENYGGDISSFNTERYRKVSKNMLIVRSIYQGRGYYTVPDPAAYLIDFQKGDTSLRLTSSIYVNTGRESLVLSLYNENSKKSNYWDFSGTFDSEKNKKFRALYSAWRNCK